jgi:antitoxin component YwqK of YwqJK toxin-antitoxin module
MKPISYILFTLSFSLLTLAAIAQQPEYPDSGFTNKAEAKNLTINGLREGKWCEYRDRRGGEDIITMDTNASDYILTVYKTNSPNGIARRYKKNGKLVSEVPFKNGMENGIVKWYYPSGALDQVTTFKDNMANGVAKNYDESGKLTYEAFYENDELLKTREYYKNGEMKRETTFINDSVKVEKNFDRNGNEIK